MKKILATILILILAAQLRLINAELSFERTDAAKPAAATLSEIDKNEKLLITEVNFKNKNNDFIKISYRTAEQRTLNLKGLGFADDKIFKTIDDDFLVQSGQEITLQLKSSATDQSEKAALFSEHNGLTSTTEQISLIYSGKILDTVCWSNQKANKKEETDLLNTFKLKAWISSLLSGCVPSEKVKVNESIMRKNPDMDSNGKNDWMIKKAPPSNTKSAKKSQIQNSEQKKTAQKTNNSKQNFAQNLQKIYSPVLINEIMPAPAKGNAEEEWIEIFNKGSQDISMSGWWLDDEEKGSKPWAFPQNTLLKQHGFLLIKRKNSKIVLGNTHDEIRLWNQKGELIQKISYSKAKTGNSYERAEITDENGEKEETWIWEKNPSPGGPNPNFRKMSGQVMEDPVFQDRYYFIFQEKSSNPNITKTPVKIFFDEDVLPAPMAKTLFTKNVQIKIMTSDNHLNKQQLVSYEIISETKSTTAEGFPSGIAVIIIIFIIVTGVKLVGSIKKNRL